MDEKNLLEPTTTDDLSSNQTKNKLETKSDRNEDLFNIVLLTFLYVFEGKY